MSREGDHVVVWLHVHQDLGTVDIVRDILAAELAASDADVVVDLGEVTFIGSTTLGAFVSARAALRQHDRELRLRAAPPRARRLLDICGLNDLLGPAADGADRAGAVEWIPDTFGHSAAVDRSEVGRSIVHRGHRHVAAVRSCV